MAWVDIANNEAGNSVRTKLNALGASNDLKAPLASPAFTDVPVAPTAAPGTNTAQISTTAFVAAAVALAVTGLLDFKGSTDCSTNPNYPAASKGDAYVVSVAGKIGGASGSVVDVGDVYVASADNAGGTQAAVGASWFILEHNLAGALLAANNLSDVINAATARTNLGLVIGTNVQAWSANLDEYAAVNPTSAGLALLDDADAAAQRTTLGLGTMATAAAADYAALAAAAFIGLVQITRSAAAATSFLQLNNSNDTNRGGRIGVIGAAAAGSLLIGTTSGTYDVKFEIDGATKMTLTTAGDLSMAAGGRYLVNNVGVVTARQTGWSADTGTDKRTANATYSGTAEAIYTQATIQALMDKVRDLSQTIKALKADLTTHGLIGA